jgi:hypothetical protein
MLNSRKQKRVTRWLVGNAQSLLILLFSLKDEGVRIAMREVVNQLIFKITLICCALKQHPYIEYSVFRRILLHIFRIGSFVTSTLPKSRVTAHYGPHRPLGTTRKRVIA